MEKDDKGYLIKDREWFDGLSADAGNSVADPRALTESAKSFVEKIKSGTDVKFDETITLIDAEFSYFEVPFSIGSVNNAINENIKSSKCFSFAKIAGLDKDATLRLFGEVYRDLSPSGDDHANIREFMNVGIEGISFPDGYAIVSNLQAYEDTDSAMATQAVISGGDEWDEDSDSWIP